MPNQEYIVTARKWRPNTFDEVVGQDHISITLRNAIKNNRIHHAYLFTGPRGVGKTTTARIYAREAIAYGLKVKDNIDISPDDVGDLDIIEIDGASNNSVEDVRMLRENSQYMPSRGKYKIYIIDEVHMLSTAAFNALLKTLEEPPPHLLFVFATTEPHKLPATILSRCQRFDFKRMSIPSITNQLSKIAQAEGISIEEEALVSIAKKADGSMRDSQSIFDQVVAFCGKDIKYSEMTDALNLIDEEFYFSISDKVFEDNVSGMFELTAQLMDKGYDLRETLMGLLEHFRNILNIKVTNNPKMVDSSENFIKRYQNDAQRFSEKDLIRIMKLIVEAEKDIKSSSQPRIRFELLLSMLTKLSSAIEIGELLQEIKSLKKQSLSSNSNNESEVKKNFEVTEKQVEYNKSEKKDSSNAAKNNNKSVYQEASVIDKVDEIRKIKPVTNLIKEEKIKIKEPEKVKVQENLQESSIVGSSEITQEKKIILPPENNKENNQVNKKKLSEVEKYLINEFKAIESIS